MKTIQRAVSMLAWLGYYLGYYKLLFIRLDELALGLLLLTPAYYLGWQSWRTGLQPWNLWLSVACLLLLPAFWSIRRKSYTLFVEAPADEGESLPLKAEERIRVRGTGHFEVSGMRRYFVGAPAALWKTELNDYILMARVSVLDIPLLVAPTDERGLWYIFVSPQELVAIRTGTLLFGAAPLPTLQITCQTPGKARASFIYLSFERADDLRRLFSELSSHIGIH